MNHYDEIDHDEHAEQARQQAEERAAETAYSAAVAKAAEIGREHGENAAADWVAAIGLVADGTWAEDDLRDYGIPQPDLSGQWADGYTPRALLSDCDVIGWEAYHDAMSDAEASALGALETDLCDAYEAAFSAAVEEAVTAACQEALGERVPVADPIPDRSQRYYHVDRSDHGAY